jgi:uncharacterized protein
LTWQREDISQQPEELIWVLSTCAIRGLYMQNWILIVFGFIAGTLSGLFGIGGGTILIPVLVYIFSFSQHAAQGTTLAAMVPPIGLLAAMRYWQSGNVNILAAALICLGFFFGGWLGAHFAQSFPEPLLKKWFGFCMLLISLNMIFGR